MIVVRKASASRNMFGIAKSPSTRIVRKRLILLRLLALALLGSMLLAASAHADAPASEGQPVATAEEPSDSSTGTQSPEATNPPPQESQQTSSSPPPNEEGSPEGSSNPPPSEETTAEGSTNPPPEETPQVINPPPEEKPQVVTPPPEETPQVITPPPVVEPVAATPPPSQEPPATSVTPPSTELVPEVKPPVIEGAPEATTLLPKHEEAPEIVATHAGSEEASATPLAASPSSLPPAGTASVAAENGIASALLGSTQPSPPLTEPAALVPATAGGASTLARIGASQHPTGLGCTLAALEGTVTSSCAVRWLAPQGVPLAATTLATTATAWTSNVEGAPAEGDRGGTGAGSHPSNPAPGPAPSGASGGSAGGSGSGLALSAFLTLAGLLLLAAPRALCRLRLACRPWLTAFFVLIPERPG